MPQVKPIATPCLWFNRDGVEAITFYTATIPDSRIDRIQNNVTDGPGGPKDTPLVIYFTLGGAQFMAINAAEKMEYTHALSLHIECKDQAEVDRLWETLGEGGEYVACGWLKDRWGVSWQIVPAVLAEFIADADQQKAARVMQAMLGMVKLDIAALKAAYDGR